MPQIPGNRNTPSLAGMLILAMTTSRYLPQYHPSASIILIISLTFNSASIHTSESVTLSSIAILADTDMLSCVYVKWCLWTKQ